MTGETLQKPALDPMSLVARTGSGYPEPFRSRVTPREKRALGDALGLTKIGINRTTLLPGKESSMRHWHTQEDEFVFVLEGEVTLRSDGGDQVLRAGMCAGFPAGKADAHQLLNLSDRPVVYLEMSNRDPEHDSCSYSDVDLHYTPGAKPGAMFTRKDGSDY
ncbi:MAG: cupin domain-containing protein [Steroidobacteraceae bacterium]